MPTPQTQDLLERTRTVERELESDQQAIIDSWNRLNGALSEPVRHARRLATWSSFARRLVVSVLPLFVLVAWAFGQSTAFIGIGASAVAALQLATAYLQFSARRSHARETRRIAQTGDIEDKNDDPSKN